MHKHIAKQSLLIKNIGALFMQKKSQEYPWFNANSDIQVFFIEVSFGKERENALSVYLKQIYTRDVFIFHRKFTLTNSIKGIEKSSECKNFFLKKNGLGHSGLYTYDPNLVKEKDLADLDFQLECEVTYGSEYEIASKPAQSPFVATLSDDWKSFFESETEADVTFDVGIAGVYGSGSLKAHKVVLMARSEFFRNLFNSNMKESIEMRIAVPNTRREIFKEFLRFLYSDAIPEKIEDLATSLLPLADQYAVESLRKICAQALEKQIDEENIVELLVIADLHHCPDLKKKCLVFAKENFSELGETDHWSQLKQYPDLLVEIMVFIGH